MIKLIRDCYGPNVTQAGAVFPTDVLACRCGSIQRTFGALSFPCLRCADGTAFAQPATVGLVWKAGSQIPTGPRGPLARSCARCGAKAGEPCRSVGILTSKGSTMGGYHAARKNKP